MTCPSHRSPSPSPPSPASLYSAQSSLLYDILPTPYGGRGAFARIYIPKNTTILQCEGPYASVVLRKFRKEVCAWCFSWCFECAEGRRNSWNVRLEPAEHDSGGINGKRGAGNGSIWTPWFCGEGCRSEWTRDRSFNGEASGLEPLVVLMNTLEKTLTTYRNAKARSKLQTTPARTTLGSHAFSFLDTLTSTEVSESSISSAWKQAEDLANNSMRPSKILEMLDRWNIASAENELLTEFEADCARFVLDGLIRKALQTNSWRASTTAHGAHLPSTVVGAIPTSSNPTGVNEKPTGAWQDLLQLQDNEFQHVKSKPFMLGVFVRVYLFLIYVVQSASLSTRRHREGRFPPANDDAAGSTTGSLLETLEMLLAAPDGVRAILARDHGNVFGIWEKGPLGSEDGDEGSEEKGGPEDDGEMFGWGMYVFGSYFNHDCTPTVRKRQHGRSLRFVTTRDIQVGDELCINYIDVSRGNGVVRRNAELSKEWFFECGCKRCQTERGMLVSS